jgi:hypothetical protein
MATKINLDTSERVDITCRKGDTFSLRLNITNADDTVGFTAGDVFLMEVRNSDTGNPVANTSDPVVEFVITVTADSDDVTAKYIDLTLAATTMKTMPSGLYAYDIEQKSGAVVTTLIYGTVRVIEDVSETAA